MNPSLPICCNARAFDLLKKQVDSLDSRDSLLQGAMAIAMHLHPQSDFAIIDDLLQGYADTIRSRVRGTQEQALIAHLHDYLFDELGFAGNTEDYYNPENSYLPVVIETRRGLPITLSLIYTTVAQRLGLPAWGVGIPGHFLSAIRTQGGLMLVDCFAGGRILTREQARQRLTEQFGDEANWSDEMLRPATHRHWLTRILQNLLNVYSTRGEYQNVAATFEMEMLLWPGESHLQRELALVLARCGKSQHASMWLDIYLQNNPDDPQKSELKQLLEVLK